MRSGLACLAVFTFPLASCGSRAASHDILLFAGAGTSQGDVAAIETILDDNHLDYSTVTSRQLNRMTEPQIRAHRLLIVPGGNFVDMGNNLTARAAADIRHSVNAAENRGIRKAPVAIAWSGGPTLDQYWEGGPQLTGWGAVVARYPDGTPAVVQGKVGSGTVILTGIHPEAPERWQRGMPFRTPAGLNHSYAARLIRAALNQSPLPHY